MQEQQAKEVKYVAASYAIVALGYLAMTAMAIGAVGGLQSILQNFDIVGGTLLLLVGLFLLNLLLALGSWRVLHFSLLKQRLFLGAAVAVAAAAVINDVLGWWRWYQGMLPPDIADIASAAVIAGAMLALGYVFLAFSLARLISTFNKRFQSTPRPLG
jgi:hypothetical protein